MLLRSWNRIATEIWSRTGIARFFRSSPPEFSFEKGQLKRIGLHNARGPNIARCLTLLTRHSNHHEKEHETAEKNKGCHCNVPPFAAISSAHRSIIFWMRSEPLARI
jgi:hypothetical protein